MHDGAIVFKTKIDNSDVQKDLDRVKRDIEKSQKAISESETAKLPLVKQAEQLKAKLQEARQELAFFKDEQSAAQTAMQPGAALEDYMAAHEKLSALNAAVEEQQKKVDQLEKEWLQVNGKVDQYNVKINKAKAALTAQQTKAAQLSKQLAAGGTGMATAMTKAHVAAKKFQTRLGGILKQVLIFGMVMRALNSVVTYIGKALKSNKQFTAELAKLKGALLAAFQPIYELLVPALIALMRVATSVVTAVAKVAALLGGKSVSQYAKNAKALYDNADAIEKIGEAAKKAQGNLAGFDELNQLGSNTNNESDSSTTDPNFSWAAGVDDISSKTKNLLGILSSIVAGFLAWKMASSFLSNGKLAAGIGLIVAGLGLLAVGIWDVTQNGFKLENVLTIIAGLLTAGLGIGLLTGSWIPLLIAAISSLLLSIVYFTGNGEALLEGLKQTFGGVYDFIAGVFTGDFDRAIEGLKNIVKGFAEVFNVVLDSIEQYVRAFFTWLNEKTGGKFSAWISATERSFSKLVVGIRSILNGLITFVSGAFTGNWEKAWEGVENVFYGIWNAIASSLEFVINGVVGFLNLIIGGINKIHLSLGGEDFGVPNSPIEYVQIPRLAKGAVIPPNREFMAVLGDQHHGTNIEAPLATIQEAVAAVMADYEAANLAGHEATVEVLRQLLAAVLGIEVGDTTIGQAANRYNQKMAIIKGGL